MHWWLTGFRWGVLSDASELSVDLAITPVEVAAIEEANSTVVSAYQAEGFPALHNPGCSWGLNPPVSSRLRAM